LLRLAHTGNLMRFLRTFILLACFYLLSTPLFADCFFVQNKFNAPIKIEVQYNNKDQENSPTITQLYLISNDHKTEAFPLNTRDLLRGLVDYQLIQVQDANGSKICQKDLSSISPDKELDIQLNVLKDHCEWQIKELGSLEQSKICNP